MKKLLFLIAIVLSLLVIAACSSEKEEKEDNKSDILDNIIFGEENKKTEPDYAEPEHIEDIQEPEIPREPEKITYNIELKGITFEKGESVKAFEPDTEVTLKAESTEDRIFLYFKDNFDRVLTNSNTYTLVVKDHTYIEAVYADKKDGELEFNTEDGKTYYVAGIGSITGDTVVIPDTYNSKPVTKIAMTAFKDNTRLKTVYIPQSISFIGDEAFKGCSGIEYINIPAAVTDFDINSLADLTSLKVLSLGKDTTEPLKATTLQTVFLEEGVKNFNFSSMTSLTQVFLPDSIEKIPNSAFMGCSSLVSVNIPRNVKSIGDSAFRFCESLQSITLPEGVESIGEYAFLTCGSLQSINFPEGLKTIKNSAFAGCNSLTSVTFPDSLAKIPSLCFISCQSLREISFGKYLEEIEFSAFSGCDSLVSIAFPDSLKALGNNAFSGCQKLSSVTMSQGIETIGEKAFEECKLITKVTIPQSLRSLESRAFAKCTGIDTVVIGANKKMSVAYSAFEDTNKTDITVLYSGTQSEWQETFEGTSAFNEMTIKFQANTIYDFESGLRYASSGDGTCHIGRIPNSEINIENLVIPEKSPANDLITAIDEDTFSYNNTLKTIVIEAPVTSIPERAFYYCNNLTEVTLPATVKRIEDYAFADNQNFTKINLPEGLVYIGEQAFYYCRRLENITLPSTLERIGRKAFYDCEAITEITLGENIKEVEENAFYGCTALQKINMSCTNAAFGNWVFPHNAAEVYYNKSMEGWMSLSSKSGILQNAMTLYIDGAKPTELIVPEGTAEIKDYAFVNVHSLAKVIIPDSVTTIGTSAFSGCTDLKYVELGRGLTYLPSYAFATGGTIDYIFFPLNIKSISSDTFKGSSVPGIFYEGTVIQWGDVADDKNLSYLMNLVYYYSEEAPTNKKLKFWHYENNEVTAW